MTNQNACLNMVKQQLKTSGVIDKTILSLFEKFPREEFVPKVMQPFAYSDMQIPLAHQQRMMTPLEEGQILQALMLQGNEIVLEVGTGTGYLTALLSQLCKKVISIDYFQDFTTAASIQLARHNCNNVELITGNAYCGWLDKAPYDVVILTGAIEILEDIHHLQVLPGGKLLAIVGKEPVMQCSIQSLDHKDHWNWKLLFNTNLPPLIHKLKPSEFIF